MDSTFTRPGGTEVSYDGAGQVTEVRNLDKKGKLQSSYRYGYDLSGSIRREEIRTSDGKGHESAVIQTYTYDSAGQLVETEKKAEDGTLLETTAYGYDGAGNRIQTETNLHTIRKAVTEVNQYNVANQLVGSRRTESAGGLGSGKASGKSPYRVSLRNSYTYNAEYTDASTGNQYLRARYYSPETGNFFTEDSYLGSLLEPLERNLYTYAENDPVNYWDPSGHRIK